MNNINLVKIYMDENIKKAVLNVLESGNYVKGPNLRNFEKSFKNYIKVKHSIGVSSGTAALFLAYQEIGLNPSDEVIVPSHTFISTVTPLAYFNAKPVFVDIDPHTYCMDVNEIKKKITPKTKCITTVHIYGHPVDMKPLRELCEEKNIKIIEDCCQAHGAEYYDKKVGTFGDIGVFSFYPSKNVTVCGDGGMIVTNNDEYGENLKLRRDHGRNSKYRNDLLGLNFRLNEIQAAIGYEQLKHLDKWINVRRKIVNIYNDFLEDFPNIIPPKEKENVKCSYYVYTIQIEKRDAFIKFLEKENISTGIYYPIPVHRQPIIEKLYGIQKKLPVTEDIVEKIVSLPLSPLLTNEEITYIKNKIKKFLKGD
ncbi:MAG: DegT/DnrJ/EryC1/StrS family aminotransferase [Promethearchaeota archaeon]